MEKLKSQEGTVRVERNEIQKQAGICVLGTQFVPPGSVFLIP